MTDRNRKALKEFAILLLAIASFVGPVLFWASTNAAAEPQQPESGIFQIQVILYHVGAHRIPPELTVPLTTASIAWWMLSQLMDLQHQARKGNGRKILQEPGANFLIVLCWAWPATMLLHEYQINRTAAAVADTLLIAALTGCAWRLAIYRIAPHDPYSSIAGRALATIQTLRRVVSRQNNAKAKQPHAPD